MSEKPCKHEWRFLRTARFTESGSYQSNYIRIDVFFCSRCLKLEQVKQEQYARETPDFFRGEV